jgi:hypothetical protein
MSWWNKSKKTLIFIFVGLLGFVVIAITVLSFLGPIVGKNFCGLVDCLGGGIEINLVGENLPDKYSIEIDSIAGKRILTCNHSYLATPRPGFIYYGNADVCTSGGAIFSLQKDVVPPKKITVTVVADGKTFSQEFSPHYDKNQPNGENCPPTCYGATIEMKITP